MAERFYCALIFKVHYCTITLSLFAILEACGKYYMHLSGNVVSFLTVEFILNWSILTKLQPAIHQLTFWPTLYICALSNWPSPS